MKFLSMAQETLGQRLKRFAQTRHGSLKKFGELIGMSPQQLSSYTGGESKPETETLERFEITGINIHWLLTGVGEMDAPEPKVGIEPLNKAPGKPTIREGMAAMQEILDRLKKAVDESGENT